MTCEIKQALVAEMPIEGKRQEFFAQNLFRLDRKVLKYFRTLRRNRERAALAKIARQEGLLRAAYKRARGRFLEAQSG